MAEPARQLDDQDTEPEKDFYTGPQREVTQGRGESGDPSSSGQLAEASKPVYDEPSGTASSTPQPDLKALEGGGEGDGNKQGGPKSIDSNQPSRKDLSAAEENASVLESEPSFYKQPGRESLAGRHSGSRFSIRGYITRRYAIFGGGMLGTIIALLFFLTLGSGPFQFIHIAQLMTQFHFSHQQDAGDDRMGRIYRFARTGGKVGETRLGWLGSKMHANMLADLEKIGLQPNYKGLDIYDGFTVDRANPESPFQGMSNEELKAALEKKGVNIKEISFDGEKASVTVKGYINQRKSLGFLSDQVGNSKVPGSLRVRILARYGLVTWHPMKVLDKKLNQSLIDLYEKWRTARQQRLATGEAPSTVDPTKAQQTDQTADGKTTTTDIPEEKTTLTSDKVKSTFTSIKNSGSLKAAGGIATVVGIVCVAKTTNDHIGEVRYVQVIAPLIRMGMDAVTVGNQIMSGQDVDADTVSFLAKSFNAVDSAGKTVSSWIDAQSIQSGLGRAGGIAVDETSAGVRDLMSAGSPAWLSWTSNPTIGHLCSGVGQAITGVVSFTVGILSGGTISVAGGLVAGALAGPLVIDKLTHLLSGEAVNVLATGAEWGNDVNYGSRLAANSMALQFGGTALSSTQTAQLEGSQTAKSQAEFNSKNIAHKLFDPYDHRSAISKLIDNSSPSFTQNVNRFATSLLHFGNLFSSFSKIFANTAHAATTTPYDYGFPEYGFSQDDLNNPAVADPYANADAAAKILDGPTGKLYIKKALECFGVDIQNVANDDVTPRWDVVPGDGNIGPFNPQTNPYNPNPNGYPKDCANPSDLDPDSWLKIRFFIFDTGIMEGYACYQGDEESCANDGFGISGTSSGSASNTPSLSSQQLAQQILANPNIDLKSYKSSVLQDVQAAAAGNPGTAGAMTSTAVLQLIATVGQSHKVLVTAIQSNGQGHCNNQPKSVCPTDPHYTGDAVDFGSLDGAGLTGRDGGSLTIIDLTKNLLPSGSRYGQAQCGITPALPNGVTTFTGDPCSHLHVDVPAGTP